MGLDAFSGEVFANPDEETTRKLKGQKATWENQKAINAQYLTKPAQLADGTRIEIGLNIASADQVEAYAHADFVGLFRTEFLYMQGSRAPIEEEQLAAYRRVLEHAGGKPVTLRTLDIGGDKTLPYLELPKEANPFLGRRALRLCLDEPELFRTQLRAALRASVYGELWIMVPMVGSLDDIRRVKTFFRQVKDELTREGAVVDENVRFGIMIEIPAIAMVADIAAQEVDFASIGTNDLCQYLCAVDRMNPKLEDYYQSYSPAMVRVIGQVASAFRRAGNGGRQLWSQTIGRAWGAKAEREPLQGRQCEGRPGSNHPCRGTGSCGKKQSRSYPARGGGIVCYLNPPWCHDMSYVNNSIRSTPSTKHIPDLFETKESLRLRSGLGTRKDKRQFIGGMLIVDLCRKVCYTNVIQGTVYKGKPV